ncbi:MLO-like protein 1 isoform X1 [Prosopis cineraria]|uniref:MLO-like protein 1 isoform X1 n=1 Tax=Prosopis cineraria TaxID=364024 RepID=UPI00240EC251|nr:MLO-like protein 1 isoform X1 [Prosopis cineraria]
MAGGGGGGKEENAMQYPPTWVVAVVYTVIVAVSFAVERFLHYGGEFLKDKKKMPLFEALQKIKEELMVLGFISLLLTVSEDRIIKICVSPDLINKMLPCWMKRDQSNTSHISGTARRLLAGGSASDAKAGYCALKKKVPLISLEAIHDLHIFIFVLAIVHVIYCVLTGFFGKLKIRQWKPWEDSNATTKKNNKTEKGLNMSSWQKDSVLIGWLLSFFKQFYDSVNKSDYLTLRKGFIRTHDANPNFDFHKYMIVAMEDDFKQVVGISWYLWIYVVIFFLLNVNGWYTYFWIGFIPFFLLLAVGTKLEHVIIQLTDDIESSKSSDDHYFWFKQPRYVLFLIHFILFQNSFEIAFFFWIWLKVTYTIDSCVMGRVSYIIVRLVIGVFIQVLCSYSTLPLYALVTQHRGDHFKKEIFDELNEKASGP